VKVALAGYKPQLNADGGYEVRNRATTSHLDETVDGWFFGINGSWNIFDGLETYGKVKAARASLESARVNYDDSVHQVELEVQQAYANVLTARETIRSQQKVVEQALEAVRLATERLAAGAGTQLDVLNAQVQLTTARSTELQARASYNTALAEYDRVTATATSYAETFNDPLLYHHKPPKDPVIIEKVVNDPAPAKKEKAVSKKKQEK
jgi:outer membrane protein TolC